MAIGEARNDRFSIFTDLIYSKLSGDGKARGIFTDTVDVDSETFVGLAAVGYTVFQDQQSNLDVIGGVKVWSVDTTISFHGGPLDGVSREDGKTWVDGMVGLRGAYYLTPEIYLTGWASSAAAVPTSTGMWPSASATASTTRSRRLPATVHSASTTTMTALSSTWFNRARSSAFPYASETA